MPSLLVPGDAELFVQGWLAGYATVSKTHPRAAEQNPRYAMADKTIVLPRPSFKPPKDPDEHVELEREQPIVDCAQSGESYGPIGYHQRSEVPTMTENPTPLAYRRRDLARLLNISPQMVDKMLAAGTIKARKLGDVTLVLAAEVQAVLDQLPPATYVAPPNRTTPHSAQ